MNRVDAIVKTDKYGHLLGYVESTTAERALRCPNHPSYRGIHLPTHNCLKCRRYYDFVNGSK